MSVRVFIKSNFKKKYIPFPRAMNIDSHQHFWHFDPIRDAWIDDTMQVIQRDFLPADLKPVLDQSGVDGCVAVQAAQSDAETEFLLQLARENDFVKGVVGWIDLQANDLEAQIQRYKDQPLLKGFRHVVQAEPEEFMLQPAFVRGVQAIGKQGYTYDILIFPNQLPNAIKLAQQCSDQPFVLDHLAKPYIKDRKIDQWKNDLNRLAARLARVSSGGRIPRSEANSGKVPFRFFGTRERSGFRVECRQVLPARLNPTSTVKVPLWNRR